MSSRLADNCWKCWPIMFLVLLAGCADPEPVTHMRKTIKHCKEFSDVLHDVKDTESARASLKIVELKGSQLLETVRETTTVILRNKTTRVRQKTAEQLLQELETATILLQTELERIDRLRGLDWEFWSTLYSTNLHIEIARLDILRHNGATNDGIYSSYCKARDLLDLHGYDKVAILRVTDIPSKYREEAEAKIKAAASDAALCKFTEHDKDTIIVGPVEDFQDFVNKLDIGAIVCLDDSRRYLEIQADRMKLGARARTAKAEQDLIEKEMLEERLERERKRQEETDKRQAEIEKRIKGNKPDPSDPDYYDKLAENVVSGDFVERREALESLLKVSPSDVESAETRKKIARAFKEAVFDSDSHFDRDKAIRGMVKWGGKFCVPYLLELLEEEHSFHKDAILKALGNLQDERAAAPVAALLGDWHNHDKAKACLKRLGPVAEDAVIAVAPSPDPKVCIAAIEILAEIGTKKSVVFLRSSITKTRNPNVRHAIKSAIKLIIAREREKNPEK